MNICYISNATIPSFSANGIQVMKVCQAMAQSGFDVRLIAPGLRIAPELARVDLWRHYGIRRPFRMEKIACREGIGRKIYMARAVLRAFRTRADVVYTRNLLTAALALRTGAPVICEVHQMPGGRGGPLYLRSFSLGKKTPRLLAPITESLRADLRLSHPGAMRRLPTVVLPDGVDVERFDALPDVVEARRRLGLDLDGFVAGYAGHFYKGKGLEVVLELSRRRPETTFLVMGGRPRHLVELKRRLRRNRIANVLPRGFVPNSEVPLHLAACDALLLPNQRHCSGSGGGNIARWTSPLKLFEYMASRRPIIASDLPVLREVLSTKDALLCNPENIDEWEAALGRASMDAASMRSMTRRSYEKAVKYSWRSRFERCMEALDREIKTKQGVDDSA